MSEVAPSPAHAVGSGSGGLMTIVRSSAGCSLVSTQSMRPSLVCLIVCLNDVSILAAVVIAIIGVAVVVLISVAVTLISAVAIVAVVCPDC